MCGVERLFLFRIKLKYFVKVTTKYLKTSWWNFVHDFMIITFLLLQFF